MTQNDRVKLIKERSGFDWDLIQPRDELPNGLIAMCPDELDELLHDAEVVSAAFVGDLGAAIGDLLINECGMEPGTEWSVDDGIQMILQELRERGLRPG